MKDFLELARERKSVRSFRSDPVPREIVEKILEVAVSAPTNCNQQLWNFVVIDDPKVRERLVAEAAGNTLFRRVPTLIAVTYDGWNYKEAIQGASLAVGHLLLAATYYGVSASPVNSYGADKKVKKVLGIPERETICCFVTLGYPDERAQAAPSVPRKSAAEVTHWNGFSNLPHAPFTYDPNDWTLETLKLHQRHYCRKTFLGKEMDLAGSYERTLVGRALKSMSAPFLDLFSYDGSYLKEFPEGDLQTMDSTEETAAYTKEAARLADRAVSATHVYDDAASKFPGAPRTITLVYKAERLPDEVVNRIFVQAHATLPEGGSLVIIARRRFSLFSVFLSMLRVVFGHDVRKTGIYAFFGPYRPVRVRSLVRAGRKAGFQVRAKTYMPFPGFFEQLYQMVVQFIRSGGTSYLHRDRRNDFVSKSIAALLKVQGFVPSGPFGSVAVIVCKKK